MPLEETQAGRHLSAGGGVVGWEVSGYMEGRWEEGRSQTSTLLAGNRGGGGMMGQSWEVEARYEDEMQRFVFIW